MHGQAVRTLFKADEKMSPEKQQRHRKQLLAADSDKLGRRYLLDGEEEDSEVDVDQPDSDSDRREGQY